MCAALAAHAMCDTMAQNKTLILVDMNMCAECDRFALHADCYTRRPNPPDTRARATIVATIASHTRRVFVAVCVLYKGTSVA